jgi:hypothetical protein
VRNAIMGEPRSEAGHVVVTVNVDGFGAQQVTINSQGRLTCDHPEASVCRIAAAAARDWAERNAALVSRMLRAPGSTRPVPR